MYKYICILIAAVIAAILVWGVAVTPKPYASSTVVLVKKKISADASGGLSAEFERSDVNTVELEFSEAAESNIKIFNGEELIYERRGAEKYRYCAFNTVNTSKLKIVADTPVKVVNLRVSLVKSENTDFRVTAYAVASSINEENVIPERFDVVTDVILFGCVTFDETGRLNVDTGLLENSYNILKENAGDKKVNFYINILGPDSQSTSDDWNEQMNDKAARHSAAFKNGELAQDIAKLVENYEFDGVFFDYEYPLKRKYWNDFDKFIKQVKACTNGKKVGIAASAWNLSVAGDTPSHADMLELMQYDLFDDNGNHSSMDTALSGHNEARKRGIVLHDTDLGLPFYGRPADRGGYWPSYAEYAETLGRTEDKCETEGGEAYFNCWQTVYDKTAYALENDIGGIMVWHFACDVTDPELSLFGAAGECIKDRVVNNAE